MKSLSELAKEKLKEANVKGLKTESLNNLIKNLYLILSPESVKKGEKKCLEYLKTNALKNVLEKTV